MKNNKPLTFWDLTAGERILVISPLILVFLIGVIFFGRVGGAVGGAIGGGFAGLIVSLLIKRRRSLR